MASEPPRDHRGPMPWPPPVHNEGEGDKKRRQKMSLTEDELRVLNECSRESFYYRSLPFGIGAMFATQTLVARGIWNSHPRFGALPKVAGAGFFGFLLGKFSYQTKCREKIMQLQNSPLADAMRKGMRGRQIMSEMAQGGAAAQQSEPPEGEYRAAGLETSQKQRSYLDVNTDREVVKGLDDSLRPSTDSTSRIVNEEAQHTYTSHDELRRKNRTEYQQKMAGQKMPPSPSAPNSQPPGGLPVLPPTSSNDSSRDSQSQESRSGYVPTKVVRRNKWGDIIEE